MAAVLMDPNRAPVAFGLRAVPQLFEELQQPDSGRRQRALTTLCDLMDDPERLYQTVSGGFLEQLKAPLRDKDPPVRTQTCELLQLLSHHSSGRQALLDSSLLPPLSLLLDDPSPSCRANVHRVLNRIVLLSAGAEFVLSLVPKLMLKLREEQEGEEGVQVLLLSTLSRCSRLDALPALACDGVSLLGQKLSHRSLNIRREAAAFMMALSVCEDGKRQVCEQGLLPVLLALLQDEDVEVQANAAGVIMFTVSSSVWTWASSLFLLTWCLKRRRRRRRRGRPSSFTPCELSPPWLKLQKAGASCSSSFPCWRGGVKLQRGTRTSGGLLRPLSGSLPGPPET
ncbi:radial spoke head 14 homolog isoform X2 [Betta splendens]|uniref:Radial spoke head 14 homolog isoform X2 n=1 Tax=Betta splendens TaxID=158456 RepID=A0A6P7NI20_BETSP|nr:radial spoke head 14 homolog isoform X2 [Betta splendens]